MLAGGTALSKLLAIEGEGRRLDRFELVAELASGGMATVFLARLSGVGGFQRWVAIKRLHPHLAREPEFIEMFLEEARLSARIHHPNVVPILEIGTSSEGYYIVMEYVEGDTLGRLLARSAQSGVRLPTKVGLRVVLDMLAGLDAAHELKDDDDNPLGIVHRDVSPQNVLVGIDGSGRLSDFGVARATSKLSTTRTGQLKGKLAYMAPEQAKGARDIDRRADIFASGVVLWEVLASRRLFKGEGEADTLNKVLNEPIPPVRGAAPTVPAALEAVVAKALERDRSKRYATAAEFADCLERAARVVGALGTHKDVAAHLEAVLGTEISQQREAVRAWLARSEPSRHGMDLPRAADPASVTRLEGREKSEPSVSGASGVSNVPHFEPGPGTGRTPSIVSGVAIAHPPDGGSHSEPPSGLPSPMPLQSARRRSRVWPLSIAVGLLLGLGAVGMRYMNLVGQPSPPLPVVAATPPASHPSTVPSTTAPVLPAPQPSVAAAPSTLVTPAPSASEVAPSSPSHGPWRGSRPPPTHVSGGGSQSTAAAQPAAPASPPAATPAPAAPPAIPDDIARNPYR